MKWLPLAALALLLQACGGGSGSSPSEPLPPQACTVDEQRQSMRTFLNDQYYWYANLAAADTKAETIDGYFQSMLYKPLDRYSYTQSTAEYNSTFTEGRRTGYGYTVVWQDDAHSAVRVRNVEPFGPVARAGIVRGDTVLSIDGVGPEGIIGGKLPTVTTEGVLRTIVVRDAAGVTRTVRLVSEDFALSPVAAKTTFEVSRAGTPVKVGYLAYHQFVTYSKGDVRAAFEEFASTGIGELVLDLRYNGGGSVTMSRDVASMIGGPHVADKMYTYMRFNDKQVAQNQRVPFNSVGTPLAYPLPEGLSRVVVITSPGTASASELLINGLKPFVDVVLVGETTYGKPFGFIPRSECGTTYNAVQFETLNSLGVGKYTAGFAPDCVVPDDLDRALGDPNEKRLKAALDYVATGRCTSGQAPMSARISPKAAARAYGETVPEQMFLD
jgi:carboxyl-terminal processing protease